MSKINHFESFYYPQKSKTKIYGDFIAGDSFIRTLIENGNLDYHDFFVPSLKGDSEDIESIKADLSTINLSANIDVHNYEYVFDPPPKNTKSVFHEIWEHYYWVPFYIRNKRRSRTYPITITSHSSFYSVDRYYLPLLESKVLPCDSIICSSNAAKIATESILAKTEEYFNITFNSKCRFEGRIDLIPLGIDIELFKPWPDNHFRNKLNIPMDSFVILWVGRVSFTDKGDLVPLINLVSNIKNKCIDKKIIFLIAGSINTGHKLQIEEIINRIIINDSVRIIGNINPEDRHKLYSIADIFVSPVDNIQECFGLTPLEAMSSGVPQIVSSWDGYKDTVVDGVTGFLIPTMLPAIHEDFISLSTLNEGIGVNENYDGFRLAQATAVDMSLYEQKIITLINNDNLRTKMAINSRKRAENNYNWPLILNKYFDLWDELLDISESLYSKPERGLPEFRQARWEVNNYYSFANNIVGDHSFLQLNTFSNPLFKELDILPAVSSRIISKKLVSQICELLKHGPLRHRQLVSSLNMNNKEDIHWHIMWLLKYNFLNLG